MTAVQAAGPGPRVRRVLLRTAFLLSGAALCVAFLLLQTGLVQVVRQTTAVPLAVVVPVVAVPVLLLGLLPGVREVEVAASRALLGVRAELVTPEPLRAEHRWRSAAWVALHVVVGGVAGLGLVVGLPSLVVAVREVLAGGGPRWLPALGLPDLLRGSLLAVLGTGGLLGAVVLAGVALARWAPWFLGPTWRDRLLLAEDRLAREAEHQRLARDLHDGIGHALSLISLQAVAGRRVVGTAPDRAASSLEVIERTARGALDELDQLLGALRSQPASRRPTPGLADLGRLVAAHRALGVPVEAVLDPGLPDAALPGLVAATVHEVAAEALANAVRHGGGGPVRLRVALHGAGRERRVRLEVSSPLEGGGGGSSGGGRRARRTGGRGLRGAAERVAVLDGRLEAGPDGHGSWLVSVELPAPVVA